MKRIMNYRGYIIKQVTEMDVRKGDIPDYKLGEFFVFNRDNEIEYDDAGTIELAKEQIDGLKSDEMTEYALKQSTVAVNEYNKKNEQVNYDNLNWKDDGDILGDPSMNDYLKGYQIDPYEFKQWAKQKNIKMEKFAAQEVDSLHFLPWYLSDKILTLWNGADGQLQDFFNAFTLRYDNKLKQELAKYMEVAGYTVYPILTDDRPRYAKYRNTFRKCIAKKDNNELVKNLSWLKNFDPTFASSEGFSKFADEIIGLKHIGYIVSLAEVQGLLDYYKQIFPEDYAIKLTTQYVVPDTDIKPFKDIQISDESLKATEDRLSGNADPVGTNKGSNGPFGYDATSYTNSDISVAPNQYETRISKKKHV